MHRVSGYLGQLDATVICWLLNWQERCGVTGNLCEVGVHHGRLFFILALSRRPNEAAIAVDLFEDDKINIGKHRGRDKALSRNARQLKITLSSTEILKGSSLDLTAADILQRARGPIRFFSVDGGHMYKHVENDLRLARECLSKEGIIAVDDFFNLKWPEVSFATYEFLRNTHEIIPVFATYAKLYLVRPAIASQIIEYLVATPPSGVSVEKRVSMCGNEVLLLKNSAFRRVIERGRMLMNP
jgi:hypothetical protein